MSSAIDPFFLFLNPTNIAALAMLLESEKYEVIDVKAAVGPCNNTIATVDILTEVEDDDGLPMIAKSGVRREIMYDRENIAEAFYKVLPVDSLTRTPYIVINALDTLDDYTVYLALRESGIHVGKDAITVKHIANTDIIHIETTKKSLRYYGEMMIAFKTL